MVHSRSWRMTTLIISKQYCICSVKGAIQDAHPIKVSSHHPNEETNPTHIRLVNHDRSPIFATYIYVDRYMIWPSISSLESDMILTHGYWARQRWRLNIYLYHVFTMPSLVLWCMCVVDVRPYN
jgi:hypothetical protein